MKRLLNDAGENCQFNSVHNPQKISYVYRDKHKLALKLQHNYKNKNKHYLYDIQQEITQEVKQKENIPEVKRKETVQEVSQREIVTEVAQLKTEPDVTHQEIPHEIQSDQQVK